MLIINIAKTLRVCVRERGTGAAEKVVGNEKTLESTSLAYFQQYELISNLNLEVLTINKT